MIFRSATPPDAQAIADLHAHNWQNHYRNAMSDHYLDEVAPTERRTFWSHRLTHETHLQQTIIAEQNGELVGFCCIEPNAYPDTNAYYLDNLHVAARTQGQGIGKRLMRQSAARLLESHEDREIFLWVLVGNDPAIGFYKKLGGRRGPQKTLLLAGNEVEAISFYWHLSEMAEWLS